MVMILFFPWSKNWISFCCSFIIVTGEWKWRLNAPHVECKSFSSACCGERNAAVSDVYLQTKVRRDTPACPWEHSGIWETNGAETAFFIPFPSVCAPLTHTTQQGTHVMHHTVISDSEVKVITLGSLLPFFPPSLPPSPSNPLSGSTLLCQPSIWWLETTHFIAVTRHDRAARPEPLDLFPALCSSTPPSERQRVGRLASLLICHGWTARKGLTPFSLLAVSSFLHPATAVCHHFWDPDTCTVWI